MTQLVLLKEIESLAHKLRTYVNEPILVTADAKHRYIENKMWSFLKLPKRPKIKWFNYLCLFFLLCIGMKTLRNEKMFEVGIAKTIDFTGFSYTFL